MLTHLPLLFDFGTLVLIWLVQLVIYPSFGHYQVPNLKRWHTTYTLRVTFIVLPLLFGQLICTGYLIYQEYTLLLLLKMLGIIGAWALTFGIFVPLHGKVEGSGDQVIKTITKQLVIKNWWRTTLWTLAFILELLRQLIPGLS
ncbi:Hypothetical protein I595_691 [Croceitalea dokdonensis DOKDO 023]|uniref:Copper resistance protein D domain-containing protein n=1 Tax=Croceitalea dokdonensis DOKDO 023 TaxID=1300341 RepID=A0A0P7B2R2_9FLAO|nr:hypothetical protein [Croceitalea dokdonensis]KPM33785.1 Hypothetical protein I595_691 [Croceitalea dokdonensis DOKDO 023]